MPPGLLDLLAYFGVMAGTFIVPVVSPSVPTLYFAKLAQPWALALAASAATALATSIDYHLVRRVFRVAALERARSHRLFTMFERWAKVAPFLTIMIFAGFPLPFFIPRILMPLSGYSARRYAAAAAIGRYPRIYVIAQIGKELSIPNKVLLGMLIAGVVISVTTALVRHAHRRSKAAAAPEAAPDPPEDKAA